MIVSPRSVRQQLTESSVIILLTQEYKELIGKKSKADRLNGLYLKIGDSRK
jgi:hypothetical protein